MNPFYEPKPLPILDPKKVPNGWESDIFGLVYPPPDRVTVRPLPWVASAWCDQDGWRLPTEREQALLDKWGVEFR